MSNKTNKEQTAEAILQAIDSDYECGISAKTVIKAMQEYAALQLSAHCKEKKEWVRVEDGVPAHQNYVRVLISGIAHILPHWYRKGKWYVYDGNSAIAEVSHWQEFKDLPHPPIK